MKLLSEILKPEAVVFTAFLNDRIVYATESGKVIGVDGRPVDNMSAKVSSGLDGGGFGYNIKVLSFGKVILQTSVAA